MTRPIRWFFAVALLVLAGRSQEATNAVPEARPDVVRVVAGNLANWRVTDIYGRETALLSGEDDGVAWIGIERGVLLIQYLQEVTPAYQLTAKVRLAEADEKNSYIRLAPGVRDVTNRDEVRPSFALSNRRGSESVVVNTWWPEPDARDRYNRSENYWLDGNGDRKLSWPEELRKTIEAETAELSRVKDTWLTLRGVFRPGHVQIWLDGMLMHEYRGSDLPLSGQVRIEASVGVQVAAIRLEPAPPADLRFQPVPLDSQLNARTIDGGAIAAAVLPPRGRVGTLKAMEVPFLFPEPAANGNDHLDIGRSWFQSATLEGHFSGRGNAVGGRWRGALFRTPARLQFRVPTARYSALHLIAAADDDPNSVPVITVQFYRPQAGFPVNLATSVPAFSATSAGAVRLDTVLDNGKSGSLWAITIPIDPGVLAPFDDLPAMEFELTKEVKLWRAYPDPSYYSFHAAGLPSSVHVYAMTLEKPTTEMTVEEGAYGHIWTAPEKPSYTVSLRHRTNAPRQLTVTATTRSYDGKETTEQQHQAIVLPGEVALWQPAFTLARYGFHDVEFVLRDGTDVWTERFALANLHPDTRERGDWAPGKGPFFGYWAWRGGHGTPGAVPEALVMGLAGADGRTGTYQDADEDEKEIARRFKMVTLKHFSGSDHWRTNELATNLQKMPAEEAVATFVEALKAIETQPSDITQTRYVSFFAEPHIGPYSPGNLPEYWGEEPWQLEPEHLAKIERYRQAIEVGVPAVRERWPNAKIMMPHGDPMFSVYIQRYAPSTRPFIDGIAVDIPCFERLPEMQLHQVALSRLYQVRDQLSKMGMTDPLLPMYEGPCIPDRPGAVSYADAAALLTRNALILFGYGVDQLTGGYGAFAPSGYWGEQHYGGGIMERVPLEYPKPMYVAYATMTRQLNRRPFAKWLPTGSLSTYCLQFKHYRDGSLTHVLWTIRGQRPVTVQVPAGAVLQLHDEMDNATELRERNGQVTFLVDQSPRYLTGLAQDAVITLGEPDHSDAKPGPDARKLANLASGWRLTDEPQPDYADNHHYQIRRTPGKMTAKATDAPREQGGEALAIHLGEQEVDRFLMPYYTTLEPRRPIVIPGKASHLGLWVKAASDWGRVVYVLRDAQDETWISVGTHEQWNADDIHSWSAFCFDGWRYLTFELPANSPWDGFREHGSTWWGAFGEGNRQIDLPLRLEKLIVERRTHTIYVNDPQPAKPDDVLLGDLYAEYATPTDQGKDVVAQSKLRRPVPAGVPGVDNPIAKLAANELPAPAITHITLHEQLADGTRCYVHFAPVEGAGSYDVWAAPYEDGTGALHLGKSWTAPGGLITGLRPDTDFWLFLTWSPEGFFTTTSKPSPAFKIRLEDLFGNK